MLKILIYITPLLAGGAYSIYKINSIINIAYDRFDIWNKNRNAHLKYFNIDHAEINVKYHIAAEVYNFIYENQNIPSYKTFIFRYDSIVKPISDHLQEFSSIDSSKYTEIVSTLDDLTAEMKKTIQDESVKNIPDLDAILKVFELIKK